jgi:hypothetical protein
MGNSRFHEACNFSPNQEISLFYERQKFVVVLEKRDVSNIFVILIQIFCLELKFDTCSIILVRIVINFNIIL